MFGQEDINCKQIARSDTNKIVINYMNVRAVIVAHIDEVFNELGETNSVQFGGLVTFLKALTGAGAGKHRKIYSYSY